MFCMIASLKETNHLTKKKTVIPAALILSSVIVTFSYLILESEKGRRGAAGEVCPLPNCVSGALSRHTS